MPYYPDLDLLLRDVSEWADLRREQGADIAPTLERLRRELLRARRDLDRTQPPASSLEREPNGLQAIKRLRPPGPRKLWQSLPPRAKLTPKLKGAWLARAAGCTLGVPVEAWSVADMEALARRSGMSFPPVDYWEDHPQADQIRYKTSRMRDYLRRRVRFVPVDDDLTYTVLGLLILEKYGPDFTTEDVAEAWLARLPMACTAEHVALENLKKGIPAKRAAERDNPYQEWIGADIRSDPWGYAAAGWPERAAELAYRDAYLSHRQNGIYGAMFFAAAIAASFAVESPEVALRIGLTEIPRDCRLARDLRWALRIGLTLANWREARAAVDKRFAGMHVVHTNNNACLTIFGLVLGQRDVTRTLGITVAMGLDNDCTAATAGSILGAIVGADAIPEHWWKPFRNTTTTYIRRCPTIKNTDLVARFLHVAEQVWATG